MTGTITVKGIGKVSTAPDLVVLSMNLESKDLNYEVAMNAASENIECLNRALGTVGFGKDSVKTTGFNVHTAYEYRNRPNGNSERVFTGYVVSHDLKVEFDFDSVRLTRALSAVGSCPAHPQISVAFTVKDPAAVSEEMLRSAAANAKRKAEVLCEASGKKLGGLVSISYDWGELNVYSRTQYNMADECLAPPTMAKCASVEIAPDDIDVCDTAVFVWEIL